MCFESVSTYLTYALYLQDAWDEMDPDEFSYEV